MTWTAKLPHHVLFATQHTGLHNQIVHNGISSLGNKCVVPENRVVTWYIRGPLIPIFLPLF